jgi:hypothetical protein
MIGRSAGWPLAVRALQPRSVRDFGRANDRIGSLSEELDVSIIGPLLPSKADVRGNLPGGRVRCP